MRLDEWSLLTWREVKMKSRLIALAFCVVATCTIAAPSFSEERGFVGPKIDGMLIDWCRIPGEDCGKPAAQEFCVQQGYQQVVRFSKRPHVDRTLILGTDSTCDEQSFNQCDGF